jgi:beta-lactamase class A
MRRFLVALAVLSCTATAFAQPSPSPSPAVVPAASAAPAASASPAASGDLAKQRIDQIVGGGKSDPSWFAASMLAAVSVAQIDAVVVQYKATLGAYRGVDRKSPNVYIARFDKGTDEIDISLDASGKIDGLLFKPPALTNVTLDDALADLGKVPHVSYVLLEGTAQRAALEPDRPLAVGSAFKLAVAAALNDDVVARKRSYRDVIQLDVARRSLPSGVLQSWPAGTPLTLATLATEMISISDNTAADALRALVAGPRLDRYASRNKPFLSTRALFVMKADAGADLLRRWQSARTAAERSAVLTEAERRRLPAITEYPTAPRALDVEWIYSVRELCGLMSRVADLPFMVVNPGIAQRDAFRRVAFKGGSEPGVLNLTTSVVTKKGTAYCLSATVNDPSKVLDESSLETTYGAVLWALANR